jgi:DNA-binding XRE family transcriptional regulator
MQSKTRYYTAVFLRPVIRHRSSVSDTSSTHAVLGRTLAQLRAEAHLTQERVAELAGIDTRSLQRVEAGEWNISVDYLDQLRRALGCTWSDLIRELEEASR